MFLVCSVMNPRFVLHRKDFFVARSEIQNVFKRKMEIAGVNPRDRVAIAVSGGADSMALCLLAMEWKRSLLNCVDGLIGLTVDHALRPESANEVVQVQKWLLDAGMECEILKCTWPEGVPSTGHLQERARKARYELLQDACERNETGIILTAHHADDQIELFTLRLSRCSGAKGLAGMALATELFPVVPSTHKVILIRPLLDFYKDVLYNICRGAGQEWIEDPTNSKMLYARNRIRKELAALLDSGKDEVQNLINVYRKKRSELEEMKMKLMSEFVRVDMDYGYVTVDIEGLFKATNNTAVRESIVAAILKFVSQRSMPPRGTSVRKAVAWLQKQFEGGLTVAGCSLCLQPGSRGSKVLVTYSPESPIPSGVRRHRLPKEAKGSTHTSSGKTREPRFKYDILVNARKSGILSQSTSDLLVTLSHKMAEDMLPKNQLEVELTHHTPEDEPVIANDLVQGSTTYYMQRYFISWWQQQPCECKKCIEGICSMKAVKSLKIRFFHKSDTFDIRKIADSDSINKEAWLTLKSLPEYVRRGLPVLVTEDNLIVAVPSVGFRVCVDTRTSIRFCSRFALDGGRSSWL